MNTPNYSGVDSRVHRTLSEALKNPNYNPIVVMGDGQIAMMQVQEASRMGIPIIVIGDGTYAAISLASPAEQAFRQNDYYINLGKGYKARPDELLQLVDKLKKTKSAVTAEFENVDQALLDFFEDQGVRLAPGKKAFAICSDKLEEKKHFNENGILCADFMELDTDQISDQENEIQKHLPGFIKIRKMGYDGKGNMAVNTVEDVKRVLADDFLADGKTKSNFKGAKCILEKRVDFAYEMSVILLREKNGQIIIGAVPKNFQDNGTLVASMISEDAIPDNIKDEAIMLAIKSAEAMDYEGLLTVEFFVDKNGTIRANEMAPRPHNSGHHTIEGMLQGSQYGLQNLLALGGMSVNEILNKRLIQYTMSKTGIPHATQLVPYVGLVNVLTTTVKGLARYLRIPEFDPSTAVERALSRGIFDHMNTYGKQDPRPKTKMAHIVFSAANSKYLLEKITQYMERLHPESRLPW